jgi:hypothetical protein
VQGYSVVSGPSQCSAVSGPSQCSAVFRCGSAASTGRPPGGTYGTTWVRPSRVERAVARHRQHLATAASVPPPAQYQTDTQDLAGTQDSARMPRSAAAGSPTGRAADMPTCTDCWPLATARPRSQPSWVLSCNTVRRFARAATPGELLVRDWTPHSPGIPHDYESYMQQRWNSGCTDATVLWQEIRARGYPGGYSTVRDHLARFRGNALNRAPAPKPPKPCAVAAWIMTRPGDLDPADQASLDAILASSPELAALTEHVRAFARLMTGRRGRDLEQWMTAAAASAS